MVSGRESAVRSASSDQGRAPESARLAESRRRETKARAAAGLASATSAVETAVGMGEGDGAAAGATEVGRSGGEAAAMVGADLCI